MKGKGITSLDGASSVVNGIAIDNAGFTHTCDLDGGAMFNGTACVYWYDITSRTA